MQKRKAQNRAAQRAFRERKEKHLKDLETKVDELQKASDDANQENGLLRAQVERLQVELREYRKRLSWVTTGSGISAINAIPSAYPNKGTSGLHNHDFMFDFPKFGDLPASHIFNNNNNGQMSKSNNQNKPKDDQNESQRNEPHVPGVMNRDSLRSANGQASAKSANSPTVASDSAGATPASTHGTSRGQAPKYAPAYNKQSGSSLGASNSDSPSSSSDSHQSQLLSSSGTSPEPTTHSPHKTHDDGHHCTYSTIDGEESFCAQLGMACGNIRNPIPAVRHNSESATNTPAQPAATEGQPDESDNGLGLDFLAQQNGGQFDPVLFGDWREPQDAILSQDFGTFFDDAFPLPDLGSPSHNFNEVTNQQTPQPQQPPKKDLLASIDQKLDEEEMVPGEDKSQMLSCTKIWYVLAFYILFVNDLLTLSFAGIVCSPWRDSVTARLMLTTFAPSCAPKLDAPRAALLSTKRTSMISWDVPTSTTLLIIVLAFELRYPYIRYDTAIDVMTSIGWKRELGKNSRYLENTGI